MNNHNKAFGKSVRLLRKSRGFTQEELAFCAHLDRTYISLLELGENSPTLDTVFTLLKPLEVTFSDLARMVETQIEGGE
jgi:transcriptional regulator with XRE-family HTH domain